MIEDRRDIELRLRVAATEGVGHAKLLREAADEIEKLRGRLVGVVDRLAEIDAAYERMLAMAEKLKATHDGGLVQ